MKQPPLNYRLILKRQQLVQRMFDTAISFRLAQLKDAWRALYSAEARLKHPLPEIRALLTQVPIDARNSEDEAWLAQFDNKSFAEQQMMEWQLWFLKTSAWRYQNWKNYNERRFAMATSSSAQHQQQFAGAF